MSVTIVILYAMYSFPFLMIELFFILYSFVFCMLYSISYVIIRENPMEEPVAEDLDGTSYEP